MDIDISYKEVAACLDLIGDMAQAPLREAEVRKAEMQNLANRDTQVRAAVQPCSGPFRVSRENLAI